MLFVNPQGCERCNVMGHAHFCSCPCHNGGPTIREQMEAQGFKLGAGWFSWDNGKTWQRATDIDLEPGQSPKDADGLMVTKVDYARGEVTVQALPKRGQDA